MKQEELKKLLVENGYENVVLFENPDYASAFVGVTTDDVAVYDYEKMIANLMGEGMNEEDAADFISYNTIRSLPYYENSPIILIGLEHLL